MLDSARIGLKSKLSNIKLYNVYAAVALDYTLASNYPENL